MRIPPGLSAAAASVLAVAVLVACHGKSTPAADPTSGPMSGMTGMSSAGSTSPNMVMVKNFSFEPMSLTVAVGSTVTWKFDDSAQHTVSFKNPKIMSKPLSNGQTFSYTFKTAGTFSYVCSIHQYMMGTVVVRKGS